MIEREKSKKLIAALKGQPFAAQLGADGWATLIDALAAAAETNEHAKEIVDACLGIVEQDGTSRMATVQDIRSIAFATRKTEVRPKQDCEHCEGTGFRSRMVRGVYGAEKCDCSFRQPRIEGGWQMYPRTGPTPKVPVAEVKDVPGKRRAS